MTTQFDFSKVVLEEKRNNALQKDTEQFELDGFDNIKISYKIKRHLLFLLVFSFRELIIHNYNNTKLYKKV